MYFIAIFLSAFLCIEDLVPYKLLSNLVLFCKSMFKRRTCIPVLKGAPVTCFCITALFGAYCLAFESDVKLIQPPLVSDLVALTSPNLMLEGEGSSGQLSFTCNMSHRYSSCPGGGGFSGNPGLLPPPTIGESPCTCTFKFFVTKSVVEGLLRVD